MRASGSYYLSPEKEESEGGGLIERRKRIENVGLHFSLPRLGEEAERWHLLTLSAALVSLHHTKFLQKYDQK